ncbi:MAG: MBOAT family protein [Methylococcaceae bacterium]|nr:MBOAT family protein [Methylococcaceae bacterium]
MLFNSYVFIFAFLPLALGVFYSLGRRPKLAIIWLTLCSLFFYGWWNPNYLLLLLISIGFNYVVGKRLASTRSRNILFMGITGNLLLLGYYKYTGFAAYILKSFIDFDLGIANIILPLGISFFTFTQIAFLVDAYRGEVKEYSFINYALFVSYFPHLIAGPILHHKEMMPQFGQQDGFRPRADWFAIGLSVFIVGLLKKVMLADSVGPYAKLVFDAAANGLPLTLFEAWGGLMSYSMQLYFDFSGYSDMAIGISLLFGIRLPINFHSPYLATSIIDFWRCWHITLSRFLRDYLYIALGGSRLGVLTKYRNLLLTMLIGGLWHGAGWNFLIWGGLHGLYLAINHLWRQWVSSCQRDQLVKSRAANFFSWLVTFLAVTIAWTFFRASDLNAATLILKGLFGMNGLALPERYYFDLGHLGLWLHNIGIPLKALNAGDVISFGGVLQLAIVTTIAFFAPNTSQIFHRFQPALENRSITITSPKSNVLAWRINPAWATLTAILGLVAIINITSLSEFLYFQF